MIRKSNGIIYKNIWLYRLVMNILYKGKYQTRFTEVAKLIPPDARSVNEFCFGDILLAEFCKKNKMEWKGYDRSKYFVKRALRHGYNAFIGDAQYLEKISTSDVSVMIGSLYHFHFGLEKMLKKMLILSPTVILSEPVINLSSQKSIIASIAHFLTNAGNGNESFRFTENSLLSFLEKYQHEIGYTFEVVSVKRDMLILINRKN